MLDDRRSADFLHELEFFMSIVDNRKASHDYFIEERYEAGIALQGWEVKAIRGGRAQIGEAYVMVRGAELYLIGAQLHLERFYVDFGFVTASEPYDEDGILHIEMLRPASTIAGRSAQLAGQK